MKIRKKKKKSVKVLVANLPPKKEFRPKTLAELSPRKAEMLACVDALRAQLVGPLKKVSDKVMLENLGILAENFAEWKLQVVRDSEKQENVVTEEGRMTVTILRRRKVVVMTFQMEKAVGA